MAVLSDGLMTTVDMGSLAWLVAAASAAAPMTWTRNGVVGVVTYRFVTCTRITKTRHLLSLADSSRNNFYDEITE